MKKRKAFLAKVLAAAIAVTAVLPGALTANAATIVTTVTQQNAEMTDEWDQELEKKNIGGVQTWHLKSGENNNNQNSDYANDSTAPAVTYASNIDITYDEDAETDPLKMGFTLYPNGTLATMRFGILLTYVDGTHWAYLGYETKVDGTYHWFLEYNTGSATGYPDITDLADFQLRDGEFTRVEIEYTGSNEVTVTLIPIAGDGETVNGEPVTATVSEGTVLEDLKTYAATAGEGETAAPIHFGFKAGSYTKDGTTAFTDINITNVTSNISGEEKPLAFEECEWAWVKEADGQVMEPDDVVGGLNYVVLDASVEEDNIVAYDTTVTDFALGTVSAVFRPESDGQDFGLVAGPVGVFYGGGSWYYTSSSAEDEWADMDVDVSPETGKECVVSMTFDGQSLSVSITPEDSEEAAVFTTPVSVEDAEAGAIGVAAAGDGKVLVRAVNYEQIVKADSVDLAEEYDRVVAEVGTENTENRYYSDKWSAYVEALDAAKEMIDSTEEITQAQADEKQTALTNAFNGLVLVDGTALQTKYDELTAEEQGLATDESWEAFQNVLKDAKAVLDKIAEKESVASTDVSGKLTALNSAKGLLVERAATTEEKADLQAGYDSVKDTANNCYTEASWNAFTAALEAAKSALESTTVTNTAAKAALDALNTAYAGLTANAATIEDLQNLLAGYDEVKATANENYTAESWKAFEDAKKNVEALLAKGEEATQFEVQSALKALQAAKAGLKKNAPVEDKKDPVNPVKIPAVGETVIKGGVTYKVTKSDAAKGTVSVSKANKSVKKVTILSTVKIGDTTFKVTAINAKAFAGCKKLTSVTIGANVTTIGKQAFSKCAKLKKVTFKGTKAPKIAAKAFRGTAKKCTVTTPKKMAKKQLTKLKSSLKKAGMKTASYKKK